MNFLEVVNPIVSQVEEESSDSDAAFKGKEWELDKIREKMAKEEREEREEEEENNRRTIQQNGMKPEGEEGKGQESEEEEDETLFYEVVK